jgi:hypothetical protein
MHKRISGRRSRGVLTARLRSRWCCAIALVAYFATAQLATAATWKAEVIPPTPNPPRYPSLEFYGVSCISSGGCVAVGQDAGTGLPLIERSAGDGWSRDPTPNVGASAFSGVSCVSPKACVAIGQAGDGPVALQWNGATWSSGTLQDPFDDSILNAVSCVTPTFCMAVGTESFVVSGGSRRLNGSVRGFSPDTGSPDRPLVALWDGSRWTMHYPPRGPHRKADYDLNGVSCTSTNACIAVGSSDVNGSGYTCIDRAMLDCFPVGALVERWNGRTWSIQHTRGLGDLQNVSCATSNSCMAVDWNGQTAARWDGHRWTIQTLKPPPGTPRLNLRDVSCLSATSCEAVGWARGTTVAEHWNGQTWAIESTPRITRAISPILYGVSCALRIGCTAVGGFVRNTSNEWQPGIPLIEHRA